MDGAYRCYCPTGFEESADGKYCIGMLLRHAGKARSRHVESNLCTNGRVGELRRQNRGAKGPWSFNNFHSQMHQSISMLHNLENFLRQSIGCLDCFCNIRDLGK